MEERHSILIVEDEMVVSMDLEMNLQRLGYLVTGTTPSGEEALSKIRQTRPDLVLMDIQLHGELDGLATAEAIHEEFGIPVVFVTANVSDETVTRSRQAGSYGFLNKPFRPAELNATIEIALNQHASGRKLSLEKERLEEEVYLASEALGQTREELQALSRHLMQVQEEERSRIARELHDDLGQQVALLGMEVDRLERELPRSLHGRSETLRTGLSRLAEGLREVSHRLHPTILSDLGLTEALEGLTREFRSQGVAIRASLAHVENVPLDVSTSLYRIAQESLQNVLKHAPKAQVRMDLIANKRELHLRIADAGQGFSLGDVKTRGGLGLVSMQERARLVGGNLLLSAEPNKGTTVLVRVPLRS